MARKRASMREGPLAELFRATEAAQKQSEGKKRGRKSPPPEEPQERTVEHVPTWEESVENVVAPPPPAVKEAPRAVPEKKPAREPELPPDRKSTRLNSSHS